MVAGSSGAASTAGIDASVCAAQRARSTGTSPGGFVGRTTTGCTAGGSGACRNCASRSSSHTRTRAPQSRSAYSISAACHIEFSATAIAPIAVVAANVVIHSG
jgi:hypothetical protein